MVHTHHDQRSLLTKGPEVRVAFWVQCRRELVESGGVDHYAQAIRAEVVSSQCRKELTHGALIFVSIKNINTRHEPQKDVKKLRRVK